MTTQELIDYYANLLTLQYVGKPKAYETVRATVTPVLMPQAPGLRTQVISFGRPPDDGTLMLAYDDGLTPLVLTPSDDGNLTFLFQNWYPALAAVTVTGSMASGAITIDMASVAVPTPLSLYYNDLTSNDAPVPVEVRGAYLADTLPLVVQNGFDLATAVGAQLDAIGKYVGVLRTGSGFASSITLTDADYRTLIQLAIIKNSADSSLATIQALLHQFFPSTIRVFDYGNMQMNYMITTAIGPQSLVQLFVTEGLLPKPMGVQLASLIYAPDITIFFGMRVYERAAVNVTPFNTYDSYQTGRPWLSYANAV